MPLDFVTLDTLRYDVAVAALDGEDDAVATPSAEEAPDVRMRVDGLAIHRAWSRLDLDGEVGDAVLGELHSADHFQGCLDDPDETARLDCARAPLASSSLVCDQGWNSTTF